MRVQFGFCSLFLFMLSCTTLKDLNYSLEGTSLNLSKKGLTEIPEEVFDMKDLKVLRLYGNHLDSIPERIGELANLERLYLGKNDIVYLPNSIGRLKKLEILSIQYNELESLPDSLLYLDSLEQLLLNQNNIKSLPDSIGRMKKLSRLELNFNELSALPASITECKNLQFLKLNRNNLSSLPDNLGDLPILRELAVVNSGPLLQIPESLCESRMLEYLEIDQVTVVPACLLVQQTTRLKIQVH